MANLSNINNKFLVTTGGNVLIGQTSAIGSSIFQVTGNSTFTGNVGISIAANSSRSLTVLSRIACVVSGTTANAAILFGDDDDDSQGQVRYNNSDDSMELRTNSTERIRISSNGTTKITTDGTEQLILHRSDSSIFLNNTIGTIKVTADDPTANVVGGQIQFTGGGTWSSNYYPTNIIFSNDNAGTLTERMRIDSSGNITVLNATSTNSRTIGITNAGGTTGWTFGNGVIASSHQFVIYDNTAGSARMLIDSSGNATFAGNVTASQVIQISSATTEYSYLNFGSNTAYGWQIGKAPASGGVVDDQGFYLYNLNTGYTGVNLAVLKSGNVGIGTTSPRSITNHTSLTINGTSVGRLDLAYGGTISASFFSNSSGSGLQTESALPLVFSTDSTQKMSISADGTTELRGNLVINKWSATTPYADGEIRFTGEYDRYVGGIKTYSDNASYPSYANGLDFFVQRHVYALPNGHRAMRITSEGNVAIGGTFGTDSQFRVELKPAATILAGLRIGYANTSQNYYDANEHFFRNGIGSNSSLVFIDSNQNLLLGGTTLPAAASGAYVALRGGDNNCIETRRIGTGGRSHLIFYNGNGIVGNIETSGSSTAYNTSSDYRLKENVVPMTSALDRVSQLKPSRFNFIADAGKTVDGFLAHEIQEIVPEAISGEKDAVDEKGNPDYQGIDQSKLVPLLVAAIQELKADNDSLKARIETLENK